MKIPPNVVDIMRAAIAPIDTAEVRQNYAAAELSDKRYRWDLFHAAHHRDPSCPGPCDLYDEYNVNDSHIDTALRAIVAPLERNER